MATETLRIVTYPEFQAATGMAPMMPVRSPGSSCHMVDQMYCNAKGEIIGKVRFSSDGDGQLVHSRYMLTESAHGQLPLAEPLP